MKILKTILGIIYPILILLLLLTNCKGCKYYGDYLGKKNEPINTSRGTDKPVDSASVVERAQHIGRSGDLKITLLWNFQGDIDLHVTQPNGNTIYYDNPKDVSTGGFLDVDDVNGGNGSAENIYWKSPMKGVHQVKLVYYQSSRLSGLAEAGTCSVVIFRQGKSPQTYQVKMNKVDEIKNVVALNIQ